MSVSAYSPVSPPERSSEGSVPVMLKSMLYDIGSYSPSGSSGANVMRYDPGVVGRFAGSVDSTAPEASITFTAMSPSANMAGVVMDPGVSPCAHVVGLITGSWVK